jgi:ATP phosphoribosyltransferase
MQKGVFKLMEDAGIRIRMGARSYRPTLSVAGFETKVLKPQNVIEMLHAGSRDIGFAGADWVQELDADLVELLDTGLNPVRLVAAAPKDLLVDGELPDKKLVIASEYERLSTNWIRDKGIAATFVRTYGATEVFPPEDADCIVDNTATGSTLRAGQLEIVDVLLSSSTRLYANPKSLDDRDLKLRIDELVLILQSVLDARLRVMLEINVTETKLEKLVELLPCLRRPTIAPLFGEQAYAVKVAVLRSELPALIPKIKSTGGTDIVVTAPDQLVP